MSTLDSQRGWKIEEEKNEQNQAFEAEIKWKPLICRSVGKQITLCKSRLLTNKVFVLWKEEPSRVLRRGNKGGKKLLKIVK